MAHRIRLMAGFTLILALFVAACSNGTSSGNTSSGGSSSTSTSTTTSATTPTPTKSKPTTVPASSVAFCTGVLSYAEANQNEHPANPINNVVPGQSGASETPRSTCSFENGPGKVALNLTFLPYPSGTPLSQFATEAASQDFAGATITTNQQVSGVGDQAWFIAGTLQTASGQVLYVVDGSIIIIIEHLNINGEEPIGLTSNADVQNAFVQIGNLIVSRL